MKNQFLYFENNHLLINIADISRLKRTPYGSGIIIQTRVDALTVAFKDAQERNRVFDMILSKLTEDAEVIKVDSTLKDI